MSWRKAVGGIAVAAVLGIGLGVNSQTTKPAKIDLGGMERYLTHVGTDKPIYRLGEKVYVRGVVLRADNHAPLKDQANAMVEIRGPKGEVLAGGMSQVQDGVAAFAWEIPQTLPGGEYTVKIAHPWTGYAPAERKFDIRAYRAPRLKSQIVFVRDGYGPGDTVSASLHVDRAEGGIPAGAKVLATARVDEKEVWRGEAKVDPAGNCSVAFPLPKTIERGEGTLALRIEDGGVLETASKTIPILLQTVDLTMYPEGGDLVAGLPNRVYIEARTPARKPADIAGVVVDEQGKEVATFKTEHEGRGRFEFTPTIKVQKYTLKINEPAGIKTSYPLPTVREGGATMRAATDLIERGEAVQLTVNTLIAGKYRITLSQRDVEVASLGVTFDPWGSSRSPVGNPATVTLTPPASADGVLIATIWDEKGTPLAERLIYRQPSKSIKVQVVPDQSSYVPGQKASVTLKATDQDGNLIAAVVGVTVTDDSVLEMIEKREQSPRLPVMVLLESDVKELADAHVYLDETNPKAPLAVDLLLGTQGWRRFAFVDPAKFIAENGDAAKRVLALRVPPPPPVPSMPQGAAGRGGGGAWDGEMPVAEAAAAPADAAGPVRQRRMVMNGPGLKGLEEEKIAKQLVGRDLDKALVDAENREVADRFLPAGKPMEAGRRPMAPMSALERAAQRNDLVAVRVYTHADRPNRQPADRVDFAETLYWSAGVKTDEKTGQATVSFDLSDAVTSFRIFADAFDSTGALGSGSGTIQSVQPFYIEPKLPLEVTTGDIIQLPIGAVNGNDSDLLNVLIKASAGKGIAITPLSPFTLKGKARVRQLMAINVEEGAKDSDFTLDAQAGTFADRNTRKLSVKPLGFPIEWAQGGMLDSSNVIAYAIDIPDNVVPGSLKSKLTLHPTPLASLDEALQRLMQEPSGCFEQTSSTSYPLTMAQQYFLTHTGIDPKTIERSRELLDKGYARLTSFECKDKGYEWFGQNPGHEALSAFGLLHFIDMAQVRQVDPAMIQATRQWILKQRDGQGGFKRERRALHTWIEDRDCSNAYITWALLESGQDPKDLEKEIATVKDAAAKSANSYVIAIGANVAMLVGDKDAAKSLMDKLTKQQSKDGSVEGGTATIVGSGGEALKIETTSFAALAWLRNPAYTDAVEKSIQYLANACKAGRFGSTQSTVLALRTIVTYDKLRAHPKAPGSVQVVVDGKALGSPIDFDGATQGVIALPDIAEMLAPGRHNVELKMDHGSAMPFAMSVNYYSTRPATSEFAKVLVETALSDKQVEEGTATEAKVTVTNLSPDPIPTPIAIIGIPGGLEVRHDQLKELVKSGKIAAYEVIGRELVLYWRSMEGKQAVTIPVSLIAAIPGTYTAPASRAYLYYTDEFKTWASGLKVTIQPKTAEAPFR